MRKRYDRMGRRLMQSTSLAIIAEIEAMTPREVPLYCTEEQARALLRMLASLPPTKMRRRRKVDDR